VPLVIADPRRTAARSSALVGSIDVPQTVLDLVGLEPYDGTRRAEAMELLTDTMIATSDVARGAPASRAVAR
jgi:arylsulfatase A-like enzyme